MQSETLSFQLTSQIQSLTKLCMVLPHTMNVISHPVTCHNNFIFFDISVHRPSPLLFPSIQNVPPTVDRCSYTDIIIINFIRARVIPVTCTFQLSQNWWNFNFCGKILVDIFSRQHYVRYVQSIHCFRQIIQKQAKRLKIWKWYRNSWRAVLKSDRHNGRFLHSERLLFQKDGQTDSDPRVAFATEIL